MNHTTESPSAFTPKRPNLRVALEGVCLPPMVSYAQNFEDVIIRRALQDIDCGFYVDIGAFDGTVDSVTRWFYDNGWRGLNVEPSPAQYAKLTKDRPEDRNLWSAISSQSGPVQISIIGGTGLSTLLDERAGVASAAGYPVSNKIDVPSQTLTELLESCDKNRPIDFLKIDAEGAEADILNSAQLTFIRPRLLIIEAVKSFSLEPAWEEWEPGLLAQGFTFAWFDGLNRFYVREEDTWRLQLFGIPPCVLDNFTPHYYGVAINKIAEHERAIQAERDQNARLAAQVQPILANCELQLAGKITECEALIAEKLALAHAVADRELQLAEKTAQFDALTTEKLHLDQMLADRKLQLADKITECEALITEKRDLARILADRELQIADKESAMLILTVQLEAQQMIVRQMLQPNEKDPILHKNT